MARAKVMYNLPEFQVAYNPETTSGTANLVTMALINLIGWVSVSENVYRSIEKRHNAGRTIKLADVKYSTVGELKVASGTSRFNAIQYKDMLENNAGLEVEATGELLIPVGYTPPAVAIGDTDTDNTGTMTLALISPIAAQTQIWPGGVFTVVKAYADSTSESGYIFIDWEFTTRQDISDDQATPSSMVAYSTSDLSIYDLCSETSWNSIDLQLQSFEITNTANVQWGGSCATDYSISRGMPNYDVAGVMTILYDGNSSDIHKDARTGDGRALLLTDGDNIVITVAKAVLTTDTPPSDSDNKAVYVMNWQATADTTGNLAEIEIGENT